MLYRTQAAKRLPSLRLTIVSIILVVLLPTLGVLMATLSGVGRAYHEASSLQMLETARTVARSVQSELALTAGMVHNLAQLTRLSVQPARTPLQSIPSVANGQLQVHRLVREQGRWRVLPGSVVAEEDPELHGVVLRAAHTGHMQLSNIVLPGHSGDSSAPMQVMMAVPDAPVGEHMKVSTLSTLPQDLLHALSGQRQSNSSVILAITDGNGRVLERSVDGERMVGKPVPDWRTLQDYGESGVFTAKTLEGGEIFFAFQEIEGTPGWVVAVGEAAASFNARTRKPLQVLLTASVATITVALLLALLFVRKALQPIQLLAQRAQRIASEAAQGSDILAQPVHQQQRGIADVPASFVAEFELLRQSLDHADEVLQQALAESRRAEQEAHKHLAVLQLAEEQARLGHWTLDGASWLLHCSAMIACMFGNARQEVVMPLQGLRSRLTADSYERMYAAAQQCLEKGEPYALEVENQRADGSIFTAYLRGWAVRDAQGVIHSVAGTLQDISEGKEQRARLQALADNLPSGALFRLERRKGGDLDLQFLSAGLEALTGLSASATLQNQSLLLQAIAPADLRRLLRLLRRAEQPGHVLDEEFALRTALGEPVWLHCRAALRYPGTGGAVWDGIVRDVTAARAAAQALRDAKDAAELAERAKSDFLATMSHEIRTPMNSVIGMSRLALHTHLDAKQRNYLEKINDSANVLLGIINDILDFSKIEAGGLLLEGGHFRLERVQHTVLSVLALKAEEKGLALHWQVQPEVPAVVWGDVLRLGQVLTNLVSNAIKFTQHGEVLVHVSQHSAQGRSMLHFAVRDSGIGLSAQQIERLFQPFVQAQPDIAHRYGGTGLGLAISKRLVQMMGGEIGVHSQEGRGSTFFFTVCIEAPEGACRQGLDDVLPEASPSRMADMDVNVFADLRGKCVLVADDNALNREVASDFLAHVGIQVLSAEDGARAIEILHTHPVDAVLMDIHMPRMDGLSATREIRRYAQWQQLPIIALTAQARREDVQLSLDAGMNGHLSKPIDEFALYSCLLQHCTGHTLPDAPLQAVPAPPQPESGDSSGLEFVRLPTQPARRLHLLQGFLQDYEGLPQRLGSLVAQAQWPQVAAAVHQLKGSASYLDAQALCALADRVEGAARQGQSALVVQQLAPLLQALAQCLSQVRAAVHKLQTDLAQQAPPEAAPSMGWQVAQPLIAQVQALVTAGDFAAHGVLQQLCEGAAQRAWAPTAQAALAAFEDLEQERALELLQTLAQQWSAADF